MYAHEMHAVVNETEELQFVLFSGEHTSTFVTFACFSFFINERKRKKSRKIETDTNFLEKDNIKNSSFKRNFMPDENLLLWINWIRFKTVTFLMFELELGAKKRNNNLLQMHYTMTTQKPGHSSSSKSNKLFYYESSQFLSSVWVMPKFIFHSKSQKNNVISQFPKQSAQLSCLHAFKIFIFFVYGDFHIRINISAVFFRGFNEYKVLCFKIELNDEIDTASFHYYHE